MNFFLHCILCLLLTGDLLSAFGSMGSCVSATSCTTASLLTLQHSLTAIHTLVSENELFMFMETKCYIFSMSENTNL